MDRETYFQETRAWYREYVLEMIRANPEKFGDLETRAASIMGSKQLYVYDFGPWTFKEGFYDAVQGQDWQSVNDYLYQEMRHWLVPRGDGGGGGCDHSYYFFSVLEAFACGADQILESIYPYELGLTQNGYPFCVVGSNLVIAKYYHDEGLLEQAVAAAVKFTGGKASKWERQAIQFLLDVLNKDLDAAGADLLGVCKGYSRIDLLQMAIQDICIPAHGLYCIAKRWLEDEEFAKIAMPKHKAFLQGYAQWRIENPAPVLKPYMVYPEDMDILNRIYAAPIVKMMLKMERESERSKLRPVVDEYQMHQILIANLKNQNSKDSQEE